MSEHPERAEMEAPYMEEDEYALRDELLALYEQEGVDGVLGGPLDLRSVAGCRALVLLGQELRFVDPDRSAAFVACAEHLASRLRPGDLGERELEDLRCEMALELVWAWIDLKRLRDAEAALGLAAERFIKGTRGHVLKGRFLDTWAVLHGNQGDFDKARQAARAALACYERAGERHFQGRILFRLSIIEEHSGDEARMEESLRLVVEALARLDAAWEPDLYLSAVHQRVACLIDLGRYREARVRLFESLGHYQEHGGVLDELQRAMLEGLTNARLGKPHAAQRELIAALFGLRAAGESYTFGLLALELCALYCEEDLAAEVRAGALKIIPVFQLQPLPPGGQKALLYLELTLQDGLPDAALLRHVARYLRELLHDPDARFRPRD
ncbi:MAG: hypothetical protein ACLGI9_04060 [Thermoanaerobaculia bacterium]